MHVDVKIRQRVALIYKLHLIMIMLTIHVIIKYNLQGSVGKNSIEVRIHLKSVQLQSVTQQQSV